MLSRILSFLLILILAGCIKHAEVENIRIAGVRTPVISLNGTWKFNMEPPEEFWEESISFDKWADILVPGECQMQGFAIKHDVPFVYKYIFHVPRDYEGKQVFIRFHGVYSQARVWVNGRFVREHFGGFTQWDCNITGYVSAGKDAVLTLEVTDRKDDISYASGYAKHQIGGVLRNVELFALPTIHFNHLYFETDLDTNFENARLKVSYELSTSDPATIEVKLYNQDNGLIASKDQEVNNPTGELEISVENPRKWDAEHPNLYSVITTLYKDEVEILRICERIGFREVCIHGNKMLVNGTPVKLRGACRHDIHPLLGRLTTPEYDKQDVLLAKECNMNFIRTSHYPPSESFLDFCDEYGLYVEVETAVCFVGTHRAEAYRASGDTQNDTSYRERYLSQLKEMVRSNRNHPSVVLWSIGNENQFGSNFIESYQCASENDHTRPIIFSYPGHVPDSLHLYDILSIHYPSWRGNLKQYGISIQSFNYHEMPVLCDEWAHVACYNHTELKEDPNVRNFWGQSLDSMWTNLFEADGGLGGAIWCMLDETFMLPENMEGFNEWWGVIDTKVSHSLYKGPVVGYGEWGIADTWRRKKPEFWNTKKAYSPTRVLLKQIDEFESGQELTIPVHNRFDHTDFNELKISWKYGDRSGRLMTTGLKPHAKGMLVIPANPWNPEEKLNLRFYQNDTVLVDEYNIQFGSRKVEMPVCEKGHLVVNESNELIVVEGNNHSFNVNRKTGLLENVQIKNEPIIKSGPYLNLKFPDKSVQSSTIRMQDFADNWHCTDFTFMIEDGIATIHSKGKYGCVATSFRIQTDDSGLFSIKYQMDGGPDDVNIQELGIKFITGETFSELTWDRIPYFSAYPEDHLGNPNGKVDLSVRPVMEYREKPCHDWVMDTKGFYYFGLDMELPYNNIARSLKENIYSFTLITEKNSKLKVFSNGTQACRFDIIEGKNILIIDDRWDYPDLNWGNYSKCIPALKEFEGWIVFRIE